MHLHVYRWICTQYFSVFVNVCVSSKDFYVSLIKSLPLSLLRLCHSLLHSSHCLSVRLHNTLTQKHTYMNSSHIKQSWQLTQWIFHQSGVHIPLLHVCLAFSVSHRLPGLNYAITASDLDAEYQWFQASVVTTFGCSSFTAMWLHLKTFLWDWDTDSLASWWLRSIVMKTSRWRVVKMTVDLNQVEHLTDFTQMF